MDGKLRIVLACRCDMERSLLGYVLMCEGFDVEDCSQFSEVLIQAKVPGTRLILFDTLSSNEDPKPVIQALKASDKTRHIPVAIIGVPTTREQATELIRAGVQHWFTRKGFQASSWIEKLEKLMRTDASAVPKPGVNKPAKTCAPASSAASALTPLSVKDLESRLDAQPQFPAFEFSLTEAITTQSKKDGFVDHISGIAHRDPLLALTLISWVNSDPAQTRTASSIPEAVACLGERTFYKRAESLPTLKNETTSIWDLGYFWQHSVATAQIAAYLSKSLNLGTPGEAMTAGLLHELGYYLLASEFPQHYGALFTAGSRSDSISPGWEERTVGVNHGQIASILLQHFGLPATIQEVVAAHHGSATMDPSTRVSSRLLAELVQAADQIANTIFPGDPPLAPLAPFTDGFRSAIENSGLSPAELFQNARKITADLLTAMVYYFPQSQSRPYFYRRKPLTEVLYCAPRPPALELVRTYLESRCEKVTTFQSSKNVNKANPAPLVVNLTHIPEVAAQVEILTSLMAGGLLQHRKAVVLLDKPPQKAYLGLVPDTCRLIPMPSHPFRWMRWLTAPDESVNALPQSIAG